MREIFLTQKYQFLVKQPHLLVEFYEIVKTDFKPLIQINAVLYLMEDIRIKKYNCILNSSRLEKLCIITVRASSLFCLQQSIRDVSGYWHK